MIITFGDKYVLSGKRESSERVFKSNVGFVCILLILFVLNLTAVQSGLEKLFPALNKNSFMDWSCLAALICSLLLFFRKLRSNKEFDIALLTAGIFFFIAYIAMQLI